MAKIKHEAMREYLSLLIWKLPDNEKLGIYNDYRIIKDKPLLHRKTDKNLINVFDNDLSSFLESLNNENTDFEYDDSERSSQAKFFYLANDRSLHDLLYEDEEMDTNEKDEMLDYMIEHWDEFENYFEEDIFDETHYDETELEEE